MRTPEERRAAERARRSTEEFKAQRRAWRKTPEGRAKQRAEQLAWRAKNPVKRHGHNLKRKFGLSLTDYYRMLAAQNGVCAICKGPPSGRSVRHFCVDHDHVTGRVRGLLCGHCNSGLGQFRDHPGFMEAAALYLFRDRIFGSAAVQEVFRKIGDV